MEKPLEVEILAYAPTAFYHCTHCEVAWSETGRMQRVHEEQLESSLPADLLHEYQAISDWVREIFRVHCDRVVVKVIDAASIEGFYKSLKYGIHRFPAVVVNGRARFIGSNSLTSASNKIADLLTAQVAN
ncbi:MAG: DUF1525 domain-containing protein [Chloroflexi bacterium]|nr:DUF1525 domain-containing protein [Chloroflexota bacterium]